MLQTKFNSVVAVTVAMVATVSIGVGLLGYGTAAGQQPESQQADGAPPQKGEGRFAGFWRRQHDPSCRAANGGSSGTLIL
jgi:hypothetical protein